MAAMGMKELRDTPPAGAAPSSSMKLLQPTAAQGRILIGVTCMFLALCCIAVGGRVVARRMVKAALRIDDYLAFLALVKGT